MPELPNLVFSDDIIQPQTDTDFNLFMGLQDVADLDDMDTEETSDSEETNDTVFIEVHQCLSDFFSFINDSDFYIASRYLSRLQQQFGNQPPILHLSDGHWFVPMTLLPDFVSFVSNLGYRFDLVEEECFCDHEETCGCGDS